MFTITEPTNLAYASAERIFLVQQYEQFPGQQISGHCDLVTDEQGNLQWRTKINGLEPGTTGHFDLGHWAGEVDLPFTANDEGFADSSGQVIPKDKIPHPLFSQFKKCKVYTSYDHLISPIAVGEKWYSNDNDQNKKTTTDEKNFLFYSLEYLVGVLTINQDSENKSILPEKSPNSPKNQQPNVFESINSFFGPPPPPSNKELPVKKQSMNNAIDEPKGNQSIQVSNKIQSSEKNTERGNSSEKNTERGNSSEKNTEKNKEKNNGKNKN